MIKKILFIFFIFSISFCPAFADGKKAFVQVRAKEVQLVFAGQRVPFYITLFARSRFAGSPRFDIPDIAGLIIMEVEDRPVLSSTTEGGVEYLSKTHEFAVFPQKNGDYTIPPFPVTFAFVDISANKEIETTYQTHEINFSVQRPQGTDKIDDLISTTEFLVKETWDPQPKKPKVGDAFKRTITRKAKDIPGMVHLPVKTQRIKGLGIYQDPPRVQDDMQRGGFTGTRTETITYVCEEESKIEIPKLKFYWFDMNANTLKEETLPAVAFDVAPNPKPLLNEGAIEGQNPLKKFSVSRTGVTTGTCVLLIIFFILKYKNRILSAWIQYQEKQAISEKAYFNKFQATCQENDDIKIINALTDWLDCLFPGKRSIPVKTLFLSFGQTALLHEFKAFEKRLYGPDVLQGTVSGEKLFANTKKFRIHIKRLHRQKITSDQGLKTLNL